MGRVFVKNGGSWSPAKAAVTIDGLTEAKAALALLPEAFRELAVSTLETGGLIILSEADARVPVDEGDLRDSLDINIRGDGLQVTVGSGDPKARWVEFATVDTPAQPFLWPAFQRGARFVRAQMKGWAAAAGEQVRSKTKRLKRPRKAA